jgi:hypothetical protein
MARCSIPSPSGVLLPFGVSTFEKDIVIVLHVTLLRYGTERKEENKKKKKT